MGKSFEPSGNTSRFSMKEKKRKANRIYNILLSIVITLIIIVSASIFLGGNESEQVSDQNKKQEETPAVQQNNDVKEEEQKEEKNDDSMVESKQDDTADTEEVNDQEDVTDEVDDSQVQEIYDSNDSNVVKAYVNEGWEPVGTEQTGEHIADFTKGSVDWNEMEKAVAYGAGLDDSPYTLWWLENGGSPNRAIGTVSTKDNSKTYRVYIEWVDGGGWKPVKVEELKVNDKR
jgi:hypothetical protein